MSSTIDWSKAPVGTTHYCTAHDLKNVRCNAWHKKENGVWSFYGANGWSSYLCIRFPDEFDVLIERPTETPAWNGEGLPPVGTVCECQNDNFDWLQGTVVHVGVDRGSKLAIMQCEHEMLWGEAGEFRPIRTPEQIAEEARSEAVRDMIITWKVPPVGSEFNFAYDRAAALYDAGYRKVEQP